MPRLGARRNRKWRERERKKDSITCRTSFFYLLPPLQCSMHRTFPLANQRYSYVHFHGPFEPKLPAVDVACHYELISIVDGMAERASVRPFCAISCMPVLMTRT